MSPGLMAVRIFRAGYEELGIRGPGGVRDDARCVVSEQGTAGARVVFFSGLIVKRFDSAIRGPVRLRCREEQKEKVQDHRRTRIENQRSWKPAVRITGCPPGRRAASSRVYFPGGRPSIGTGVTIGMTGLPARMKCVLTSTPVSTF